MTSPRDRYGSDVLSGDWRRPRNGRAVEVPATKGEVVEEVETDFCGEIVQVDRDLNTSPSRTGAAYGARSRSEPASCWRADRSSSPPP